MRIHGKFSAGLFLSVALPILAPAKTGTGDHAGSAPATTHAATSAVSGTPLVQDSFQENTNVEDYKTIELIGLKPSPVDKPDTAWQLASGDDTYEMHVSTSTAGSGETAAFKPNTAYFHNVASAALSLAGAGTFSKPAVLTISGDLSFSGAPAAGYVLLGYYATLAGKGTTEPLTGFTGLQLLKDGSLQMVVDGAAVGTPVAFTGTYDPAKPTTLIYTVDTSKGTLSNVSLAGSTSAYAFNTSAIHDAATAYVGIGGRTDGSSSAGVGNFKLSAGPESLAMLPTPPAPAPPPAPTPAPPAATASTPATTNAAPPVSPPPPAESKSSAP